MAGLRQIKAKNINIHKKQGHLREGISGKWLDDTFADRSIVKMLMRFRDS